MGKSGRCCCGNLAGGAGAVFLDVGDGNYRFINSFLLKRHWHSFIKKKDPLYGGYRGGPAYYIHAYVEENQKKKRNKVVISVSCLQSPV